MDKWTNTEFKDPDDTILKLIINEIKFSKHKTDFFGP